jgi:hypothetical protein
MELELRKINFVQEFLKIQDEQVISDLEELINKNKIIEGYENNLKPMTIEEFNLEIDKSEDDIANGRVISAKDLKSEVNKWN